jgi:hypothetical protein
MNDVYRQEQTMIDKRESLAKDNDVMVLTDVKTQNQELSQEIKEIDNE